MRVLILGAAGRSGRAVRASLFPLRGIDGVILADGEAEALNKLAAVSAPFAVSARFLDAGDARSLRERVSEADLVIGCLGPAYRYEEGVVDAVLEVGRDYISLGDDTRAYLAALSREEEARRKGVRIFLGCGMAPGLSGLLARRAAAGVQGARKVEFFWSLRELFSLGDAAVAQMAHSFAGKASLLRARRADMVRAGSWGEAAEFPPPTGRCVLYYIDHPEPLTVSRFLPDVEEAGFKAGLEKRGEELILHTLAWLGEENFAELWWNAVRLAAGLGKRMEDPCPSSLRVTVEGMRREGRYRVSLGMSGDYYRLTGLVAAELVYRMMEAGRLHPGVHTLEECLDDRVFFDRLHHAGARFFLAEECISREGDAAGRGMGRAEGSGGDDRDSARACTGARKQDSIRLL